MARTRFRQHYEGILLPLPSPVQAPSTMPVPPTLPQGYGEALTWARRYNRSYSRLSRSMYNTYGPIPRDISPAFLHNRLAPREDAAEREAAPITQDLPVPDTSSVTTSTPTAANDSHTTIITAVCVILAIAVIGSWSGSVFVTSTLPRPTVTQKITRINQFDPAQYGSPEQYKLWSSSACSAAAMTAVINAYGYDYRLADILKVEAGLSEITPELGLQHGASSIARTVASFGFSAHALDNPSLDDVLKLANAGTPVIVDWPPQRWQGGHILVVRGGDEQNVDLVDSSKLNIQSMKRSTFLKYWIGFAVVVSPNDRTPPVPVSGYSVLGPPSISADFINQVLEHYHSPAEGYGQALYDLGIKYGVDPAFALAFFLNESAFGTRGEATVTLALGNERCIPDRPCVDQDRGGYAQFYSWEDGFEHWYMLITGPLYEGSGLVTVAQIIPRYAPNSDNNNEEHYVWVVEHAVDTWRAGKVVVV